MKKKSPMASSMSATVVYGGVAIFNAPDGSVRIEARLEDGNVWLSQKLMAELYQVQRANITQHLMQIFKNNELQEDAVCKPFLHTASDGKDYTIKLYNLEAIIHVGYRVRSSVGALFRAWATERLREYMLKGFTLDDERLKNPGVHDVYYEELLRRIRDIRTSEKRFYQKVRDIIAQTSTDYLHRKQEQAVKDFFAALQNKLLYAVTGHTAAEIIRARCSAVAPNMGLTSFDGAVVRVGDVCISKNYLHRDELDKLNDLVQLFILFAEDRARGRNSITLDAWMEQTNDFLTFYQREVLMGKGRISHAVAEEYAKGQYALFDADRKNQELVASEAEYMTELEATLTRLQGGPA